MDTNPIPGLADWTRDLDEGLADLVAGRLVDGADVLAELDAALAEMEAEPAADLPGMRR